MSVRVCGRRQRRTYPTRLHRCCRPRLLVGLSTVLSKTFAFGTYLSASPSPFVHWTISLPRPFKRIASLVWDPYTSGHYLLDSRDFTDNPIPWQITFPVASSPTPSAQPSQKRLATRNPVGLQSTQDTGNLRWIRQDGWCRSSCRPSCGQNTLPYEWRSSWLGKTCQTGLELYLVNGGRISQKKKTCCGTTSRLNIFIFTFLKKDMPSAIGNADHPLWSGLTPALWSRMSGRKWSCIEYPRFTNNIFSFQAHPPYVTIIPVKNYYYICSVPDLCYLWRWFPQLLFSLGFSQPLQALLLKLFADKPATRRRRVWANWGVWYVWAYSKRLVIDYWFHFSLSFGQLISHRNVRSNSKSQALVDSRRHRVWTLRYV